MITGEPVTRDQWESMATATFVPVRISRIAPNFSGDMTHSRAGDAGLSRVRSAPCEVVRTSHEISGSAAGLAAFSLQLSGPIEMTQAGSHVRTPAGSGVLYLTDEPYVLSFPSETDLIILQAPIEHFGIRLADLRRARGRTVSTVADQDLQTYVRLLRSHCTAASSVQNGAYATRVGVELLSRSLRRRLSLSMPTRSHEALLLSLKSRVAEHIGDICLDIGSLARAEGISPRTVHTVFDRAGTTPARYIREARLVKAQRLLVSTTLRVADIALVTGFADHSTMTRVFRRDLGFTPSDVRVRGSQE